MLKTLKPLLPIMLCAVLALTGHSMALARGASAATGQMVICSGTSTVIVYIDAQGQPTAAPHLCPDCILTLDAPPLALWSGHYTSYKPAEQPRPTPAIDKSMLSPAVFQPRGPPLPF